MNQHTPLAPPAEREDCEQQQPGRVQSMYKRTGDQNHRGSSEECPSQPLGLPIKHQADGGPDHDRCPDAPGAEVRTQSTWNRTEKPLSLACAASVQRLVSLIGVDLNPLEAHSWDCDYGDSGLGYRGTVFEDLELKPSRLLCRGWRQRNREDQSKNEGPAELHRSFPPIHNHARSRHTGLLASRKPISDSPSIPRRTLRTALPCSSPMPSSRPRRSHMNP